MILITALPRTGKSTAIAKIVNMLGVKNCGGFYTEEIREDGERVGFKINSLNDDTGILAHVSFESDYRISRYGVDLESFEKICLKELERSISSNDVKYIIIDEIGPMQLFSEKYKELLLKLTKIDKPVIGTIFYNSYEWLDDFKKNDNVNIIEISLDNRDELPLEIVSNVCNDPTFQRKIEKAKRYMTEDDRFEYDGDKTVIHSEHGVRTVNYFDGYFSCDCEYYQNNGTCSHIIAIVMSNKKIKKVR